MLRSVLKLCARLWPLLVVALLLPACCAPPPAAEAVPAAAKPVAPPAGATAGPGPLVDAAWLAARLDDPGVRVLDIRGDAAAYEAGHIPGAVFADKAAVGQLLDDPPGMPQNADALAVLLRTAGVSDAGTVVIYDASTSPWAGRLFWALEYLGHGNVRVLDGGLGKWTGEALPMQTGRVTPSPGDLTARPREDRLATKDWILARLGDPRVLFLDVRAPAEYTGEEVMAAVGGHIPGAINLEWKTMLAEDGSGTLRPLAEIREILAAAVVTPDREIVVYCQVGGRAGHTYLALRLAGFERVRMYEGSWAEWGNDPTLPIETTP